MKRGVATCQRAWVRLKAGLHPELSWERLLYQLLCAAMLWLAIMAGLASIRLLLLSLFRTKLDHTTNFSDIVSALVAGVRFDARIAGIVLIVPLLAAIACGFWNVERFARRIRQSFAVMYVVVTVLLGRITIGFFREYNDNINTWLLGFYYDDTTAIMRTLDVQYNLWGESALLMGLVLLASFVVIRLDRPLFPVVMAARLTGSVPLRVIFSLAIIVMFITCLRGSLVGRPLQFKDAGVTRDEFLNKIVINPYIALDHAITEHLDSLRATNISSLIPLGDLRGALQYLTGHPPVSDTIDEQFRRVAPGVRGVAPRHIFLVL